MGRKAGTVRGNKEVGWGDQEEPAVLNKGKQPYLGISGEV